MTFARAKPGGYTDDVDLLPADEIDTIDVNQSRAVDGNAGGTYAPSAKIEFNGLGFGGLQQDTTLEAGETLTVEGQGSAGGTIDVAGLMTRAVTAASATGGGRLPWRLDVSTIDGASGNVTIRKGNITGGVADIYVNQTDLSGDRTITIGALGNEDGEIVVIVSWHSNNNMIINSESGGNNPIATITDNAITGPLWVAFVWDTSIGGGAEWVPFMRGNETEITTQATYPS